MAHKSIKTTARYIKINRKMLKEIKNPLDDIEIEKC